MVVLGFIIISRSGIPLIIRGINPEFFAKLGFLEERNFSEEITQKGSLASSLITAIVDFSNEIFGESELSLVIKGLRVHIKRIRNYLVCIFSREEKRNVEYLFKAVDRVLKDLGYSDVDLEVDWEKRYKLLRKLDSEIIGKPFPKDKLLDLLNYLEQNLPKKALTTSLSPKIRETNEVGLERLLSREMVKKRTDFANIIENFYNEKFWEALVQLSFLESRKPSVLSKVFLIALSLFLRLMHPSILTPRLDDIKKLVDGVEDEILRDHLRLHIDIFDSMEKLKALIDNTSVLMDKLEKVKSINPYLLHIHEILSFLKLNYGMLPEKRFMERLESSHSLSSLYSIYSMLFDVFKTEPIDKETFLQKHSELYAKVQSEKYEATELAEYLFSLLNIPRVKELSENEKYELFEKSLQLLSKIDINEILEKDNIPNTFKGFLLFAIANLLHIQPMLFKEHAWDKVELFSKILGESSIWVLSIFSLKRDVKANIHLYASALLSACTTIFSMENKDTSRYVKMLSDLVKDEFENLWYVNKMFYLEVYTNYLITLGNIAMGLKDIGIKANIMTYIVDELKNLTEDFFKEENYMREKANNYLLRFSQSVGVGKTAENVNTLNERHP